MQKLSPYFFHPSSKNFFHKEEISNLNLIVGTLYPDGELKKDVDGIGFACPNPILCYIQRVDTPDELKNFILGTMGAVGRKYMRRIAYRLLDILPPLEYKFKLFWLEGDVHVRAMFDLNHMYDPFQVMELLVETREHEPFRSWSIQLNGRPGGCYCCTTTPDRRTECVHGAGFWLR
ncbi:hypothetical protein PIB30_009784 [Stylosanthes scabra]|uniref:Uncharacterized protein n=1 Tax=Stylosanthes scabra TaxID=79078 RepID=A0ABU6Y5G8_9FABA|nr:hypothetical protein [Stylosanthes scabra]